MYSLLRQTLATSVTIKADSITKASASQMLRIMQALSSEAQEAGVADMSLDEINAEIDAARNGK